MSGGRQPSNDISIGGDDQRSECQFVDRFARPQLDMSHRLARSLEKSRWIREGCTVEESDVDVILEDTDVGKRRIIDADCWESVMEEFSNVGAALPHSRKTRLRQHAELVWLSGEKGRNCGSAVDGAVEPQKGWHDQGVFEIRV